MPRNNESRLGVRKEDESSPSESTNSLLNFVIPTEFVPIPTKGKFYPPDHPLHNVEQVEMRYMSAKETDILTSKSLLKKGIAIDRMIESLVVDKNIKANEIFTGDKNALVVAARISGFGENYDAHVICEECGHKSEQSYDLSTLQTKETPEDIEFSEHGTFYITLPKTGVVAECCLLTGKDEAELLRRAEKRNKMNLTDTTMTDQYKMIIVSLNGVTERSKVEEFVDVMPAMDASHLRKEYDRARPDVDMSCEFECQNCGAENDVNIPFSTNFFWPK